MHSKLFKYIHMDFVTQMLLGFCCFCIFIFSECKYMAYFDSLTRGNLFWGYLMGQRSCITSTDFRYPRYLVFSLHCLVYRWQEWDGHGSTFLHNWTFESLFYPIFSMFYLQIPAFPGLLSFPFTCYQNFSVPWPLIFCSKLLSITHESGIKMPSNPLSRESVSLLETK